MKKSIFTLIFSLAFGFFYLGSFETASANFDDELKQLSEQYNFEIVDLNTTSTVNSTLMEFENLEEFEKFLQEVEKHESITFKDEIIIEAPEKSENLIMPLSTKTYSSSYDTTWWSPINGYVMGIFSLKYMSFDYSYQIINAAPQFVSVSNVYTEQLGYHDVKWTHSRGSDYNIKTTDTKNDTVEVIALGTYTLGVSIGGQPIGYSWHGEWTRSLQLKSA